MDNNTILIDKNKFKRELVKRGLSFAAISEEMGRNKNYISNYVFQGGFTKPTVAFLEKVYGIKPEAYELREETAFTEPIPADDYQEKSIKYLEGITAYLNAVCRCLERIEEMLK